MLYNMYIKPFYVLLWLEVILETDNLGISNYNSYYYIVSKYIGYLFCIVENLINVCLCIYNIDKYYIFSLNV